MIICFKRWIVESARKQRANVQHHHLKWMQRRKKKRGGAQGEKACRARSPSCPLPLQSGAHSVAEPNLWGGPLRTPTAVRQTPFNGDEECNDPLWKWGFSTEEALTLSGTCSWWGQSLGGGELSCSGTEESPAGWRTAVTVGAGCNCIGGAWYSRSTCYGATSMKTGRIPSGVMWPEWLNSSEWPPGILVLRFTLLNIIQVLWKQRRKQANVK